MTLEQFRASLSEAHAPRDLSAYLLALWHDAKNNWEEAHNVAQDLHDQNGSWIHAYLHRKEGDRFNANYWYAKAGKTMPEESLEKEWESLAQHFLTSHGKS
jgi:hypothetical protein